MPDLDDALDSMTSRQVEALQAKVARRLRACMLCGSDGAHTVAVRRGKDRAALLLCPACFEKHRLPDTRVATGPGATLPGDVPTP